MRAFARREAIHLSFRIKNIWIIPSGVGFYAHQYTVMPAKAGIHVFFFSKVQVDALVVLRYAR
jgi:hypothetical protein